jgi:hypothetical protein
MRFPESPEKRAVVQLSTVHLQVQHMGMGTGETDFLKYFTGSIHT